MGGGFSGQPVSPDQVPRGRVDPTFVGSWVHHDLSSITKITFNKDGTYLMVTRLFEETHLISTNKEKGDWGRFSRYLVLKGKLLYFGFGCGSSDSKNWMEFLGSKQLIIEDGATLSQQLEGQPEKLFSRYVTPSFNFCRDWETVQAFPYTKIVVKQDETFTLIETNDSKIETHYRGDWFYDRIRSRGIYLHSSHVKSVNPNVPAVGAANNNKGKLIIGEDSDEESDEIGAGPEKEKNDGQEKECSQIWGLWNDKQITQQLRLIKSPKTDTTEPEKPKKEYYLPGKGKIEVDLKTAVVQLGEPVREIPRAGSPAPVIKPPTKIAPVIKPPTPFVAPAIRHNSMIPTTGRVIIPPTPLLAPLPTPAPTPLLAVSPTPVGLNANPMLPPPPPSVQVKAKANYSQQLATLKEMGFTDEETLMNILDYTGGNLQDALEEVMASLG